MLATACWATSTNGIVAAWRMSLRRRLLKARTRRHHRCYAKYRHQLSGGSNKSWGMAGDGVWRVDRRRPALCCDGATLSPLLLGLAVARDIGKTLGERKRPRSTAPTVPTAAHDASPTLHFARSHVCQTIFVVCGGRRLCRSSNSSALSNLSAARFQ